MRSLVKFSGAIFFISFITSCATITRGTEDVLNIESDPPNAQVVLSNGLTCKTPCSLKLKRKDSVVVKISKDGYQPVEVNVVPKIAGAGSAGMAGNVVLGGIIGAAVDAGSGAMYDLTPNPIKVTLEKAVDDNIKNKENNITEKLKKIEEMKQKGLISQEEFDKLKLEILKNEIN